MAITPEQWRRMGAFFEFRGRRLFYVEGGEGPPLLLLHAYPSASWGWHELWPDLTDRFRVIAPDLLGSGFSDKPVGRHYSIFNLVDGLEALLADRGFNECHVMAHAYGVTSGQELLARHVDRVREDGPKSAPPRLLTMTFVNGGLFPEATRPTLTQKLLISPVGKAIVRLTATPYRAFRRKLARNFGPNTQPDEQQLQHLWRVLTYNDGHRVVPDVLQYLKERFAHRERWVGALQQTDIPLQLVNGAADPVSGTHVPQRWKRLLPDARLVQLNPNIGHYPPLEAPGEVLRAFLEFVEA
jgi:pimeloyl-ACP methyl ester carboxylesterase